MSFYFKQALRDTTSILAAFAGGTGSGKTLSALLFARGLCGGDDGGIYGIDSEAGRMKHYACAPGERPGPFKFAFMHGELTAPFTPDRYLEAIGAAEKAGARVILIDSASHEYAGDGGLQDMHDAELERLATEDGKLITWKLEKMSAPAWKKPKLAHKKMMTRLLQVRAHLVFCLRAEPKIKFVKDERGKTQIVDAGWQPICEKMFMFEMTCSFLMDQERPGIGRPIKLNDEHRPFFPEGERIGPRSGELMAAWARGAAPRTIATPETNQSSAAAEAVAKSTPPSGEPIDADYLEHVGAFESRIDHAKGDADFDAVRKDVIADKILTEWRKTDLRTRIQTRRRQLVQRAA